MRRRLSAGLALLAALGVGSSAGAQAPPLNWYTNSPLLVGSDEPTLELTTDADLEDVRLTVRQGRRRSEHAVGVLRPGDSARVVFDAEPGRHEYEGELEGTWNGEAFSVSFAFPFDLTEGLTLELPLEDVDLAAHRLTLVLSRPADRVEYRVMGDDGSTLGAGSVVFDGAPAGTRLEVPWEQSSGTVLRIALTAHDVDGFWAEIELLPWAVAIPHEEVNFATGSDAIPDAEVHKIEDAYEQLLAAVARYGALVEINLYVAGYTDTVGGRGDNQALSERRARSIAEAFRGRGFSFAIFYQGFGEDAPAVATGDDTDEVRNRRALYLLAAQPPLPSAHIPRSNWRRLD